jgi:Fms-interacting protein/Thoc5
MYQSPALHKQSFLASAAALIELKSSSRSLHTILEQKKKTIDEEKGKVDTLQLKLQNLLYKQAYLEREIRTCQHLATPSLNALEQELNIPLKAGEYRHDLVQVHDDIVQQLHAEKLHRMSALSTLDQAKHRLQASEDVLERKRRCVDVDLLNRVEAVQAAASGIKEIFRQIQDIENNTEI